MITCVRIYIACPLALAFTFASFFAFTSLVCADDTAPADIQLNDGTVLKNAVIVKRDPAEGTVQIRFTGGVAWVHSDMVPAPVVATAPTGSVVQVSAVLAQNGPSSAPPGVPSPAASSSTVQAPPTMTPPPPAGTPGQTRVLLQRVAPERAKFLAGVIIGIYREGVVVDCGYKQGTSMSTGSSRSVKGNKTKHFGESDFTDGIAATPDTPVQDLGKGKNYVYGRFLVRGLENPVLNQQIEIPAISAGSVSTLTDSNGTPTLAFGMAVYQVVLLN